MDDSLLVLCPFYSPQRSFLLNNVFVIFLWSFSASSVKKKLPLSLLEGKGYRHWLVGKSWEITRIV